MQVCSSPLYCDREPSVVIPLAFAEKGAEGDELKPGDLPINMSVFPVGEMCLQTG